MFLKHFSKLISRVSKTQVQWRKSRLVHLILMLWQRLMWIFCTCGTRVFKTWVLFCWRNIKDLENKKKKEKRVLQVSSQRSIGEWVWSCYGWVWFCRWFHGVGLVLSWASVTEINRWVGLVLLWVGLILQVISWGGFGLRSLKQKTGLESLRLEFSTSKLTVWVSISFIKLKSKKLLLKWC